MIAILRIVRARSMSIANASIATFAERLHQPSSKDWKAKVTRMSLNSQRPQKSSSRLQNALRVAALKPFTMMATNSTGIWCYHCRHVAKISIEIVIPKRIAVSSRDQLPHLLAVHFSKLYSGGSAENNTEKQNKTLHPTAITSDFEFRLLSRRG